MAETDAMAETEESTAVLEELRVSPTALLAEAMAEASAGGGGAVGLR
ncbi:sarcosine oxidase subunit gamma, partial [Burkholderia multivorans]